MVIEQAFRDAPSRMLVVSPEAPFEIRAATDWYHEATFTTSEIIGRPMFEVFPDNPGDPAATGVARLTASFERALAHRSADVMPLQRYDVRDRRGEFVERYWTPINRPAISRDGTVLAVVHRVEDVTKLVLEGDALWEESARLNEKLEVRAHDLALANALRDEVEHLRRIAAIVAHDLRSPLSTISTGIQVLSMQFQNLGAAPPRTVELVRSAAARMEHLLNDLDDYWITEFRGVLAVEPQRVDVRDICDEVVRALQVTYPGRTLDLKRGDGFGATVDPMRIRQLLTNLLNNAITYGAPDRPVLVAVSRVTGGFVITVSNEGTPIPEQSIPTLFEPFQRGPPTGGARQRGHKGLGLFIVQQIVRAHEGKISVESTPGRTCFTVFIPTSPSAGGGDANAQPSGPDVSAAVPD